MVDVILLVVDTRSDADEAGSGRGGAEQPDFIGSVRAGFKEEELAVSGAADAEVEALVGLVENFDVGGDGVAEEKRVLESAAQTSEPTRSAVSVRVWPVSRFLMARVYWRKPVLSVV
jgi:hypothetical protein